MELKIMLPPLMKIKPIYKVGTTVEIIGELIASRQVHKIDGGSRPNIAHCSSDNSIMEMYHDIPLETQVQILKINECGMPFRFSYTVIHNDHEYDIFEKDLKPVDKRGSV